MAPRGVLIARVVVALAVVAGLALYAVRAVAINREMRAGAAAYEELCDKLTRSAAASGSPGAVALLVASMESGLNDLRERYPRWYEAYRKDPTAYQCGPVVPDTQVGSDR